MKQNNLKLKNLSKKPLRKRQVSFGVISVEKNLKSETLVIAREQSLPAGKAGDRSNLTPWRHPEQSEGSLYRSPRFARNDKGVIGRNFGFLILNFKSWHKISVAENARSKTFPFFQTARRTAAATNA